MTPKKVPIRKCLGCMQGKPKKELVRVVRPADGDSVCVDATGRKNGRGAYLCPSRSCLQQARKAHRLERALECEISDDVYAALEQTVEQTAAADAAREEATDRGE